MSCTKFGQIALSWLMLVMSPLALAKPGPHPPFEVTGQVVKNHDGDTIKLDTAERGVLVIRLSGADTPETGQAYWKSARGFLKSMVAGKPTTAWCYKWDRHDREVCHVRVGNRDLGQALIEDGYAWYAEQFASELSEAQRLAYSEGERRAQAQRLGLWQDADPMPPWECRKLKKARQHCR